MEFSHDRPGRTNYIVPPVRISLGEMLTFRSRLRWKKVIAPPVAAGLLVQMDLGWLECMPPSGVFKINLAGANNLVPTTGFDALYNYSTCMYM